MLATAIQEHLAAASNERFLADEPTTLGGFRYPGDTCCILYEYANFGGDSVTYCHENVETLHGLSGTGWNERAHSWNCGKSVKYNFRAAEWYDDDEKTGDNQISGAGNAANSDLDDWAERIAYLDLSPYDATVGGAITVFEHPYCQGKSARLVWEDEYGEGGRYTTWDMGYLGMEDNMISSATIPYGYSATMYEKDGFKGPQKTFQGSYSTWQTNEMECQGINSDVYSSIKVMKDAGATATGYWSSITSTEPLKYTLEIGLEKGNEHESSSEARSEIALAMEAGFSFYGAEAKTSISANKSRDIKQDVRQTVKSTRIETITTGCTPKEDRGAGVGLFQWVVSAGEVEVKTGHYLCRYGPHNTKTSPACPWNACLDDECTVCTDDWSQ